MSLFMERITENDEKPSKIGWRREANAFGIKGLWPLNSQYKW